MQHSVGVTRYAGYHRHVPWELYHHVIATWLKLYPKAMIGVYSQGNRSEFLHLLSGDSVHLELNTEIEMTFHHLVTAPNLVMASPWLRSSVGMPLCHTRSIIRLMHLRRAAHLAQVFAVDGGRRLCSLFWEALPSHSTEQCAALSKCLFSEQVVTP